MNPKHVFCKRCQQTTQLNSGRFHCGCHIILDRLIPEEPIPESWVISVEALNPEYYQIVLWLAEGRTTAEIAALVGKRKHYPKRVLDYSRKRLHLKTSFQLIARVVEHELRKSEMA